jgi:hypothetical protein
LFRLVLLLLFVSLAMVVARGPVERSARADQRQPDQATLIGLAAEVLAVPVLVLTCIVLAISIVGIPLLLLMPFVIVLLLLLALVGFTGAAVVIGQWPAAIKLGAGAGFADAWLGYRDPLPGPDRPAAGGVLTGPIVSSLSPPASVGLVHRPGASCRTVSPSCRPAAPSARRARQCRGLGTGTGTLGTGDGDQGMGTGERFEL